MVDAVAAQHKNFRGGLPHSDAAGSIGINVHIDGLDLLAAVHIHKLRLSAEIAPKALERLAAELGCSGMDRHTSLPANCKSTRSAER